MKACPFCAEQIQDAAIFCRFCRKKLDAAPAGAPEAELYTCKAMFATRDASDIGDLRITTKRVTFDGQSSLSIALNKILRVGCDGHSITLYRSDRRQPTMFGGLNSNTAAGVQEAIRAASAAARGGN